MLKNAFLSIKKNIGKTILLFVIMIVIANLIIAGLSIQSASKKSMAQIRSSLGNDVTLMMNMKNMIGKREKGQVIDEVTANITIAMADQLKDLQYVENHNYSISVAVNSDGLSPVELITNDKQTNMAMLSRGVFNPMENEHGDFIIDANTTMAYLETFSEEKNSLRKGRLLSSKDAGTNNCVVETTLANDNDLEVGDSFVVLATVDEETISQELKIVGIYENNDLTEMSRPGQNPFNTIYTDLGVGQTLTGSTSKISSATYYLDDPKNIETFQTLAKKKSNIDFETYTLDVNDHLYQRNINSLENTQSFATMFLVVVIIAGSAILCLILILTIRNCYYEIGIFLSLGQSKIKIILQQLIEILLIAAAALIISLGTGKMIANVVSSMLETNLNNNHVQMEMTDNALVSDDKSSKMFDNAFKGPEKVELDVLLTSSTIIELAGIMVAICLVSIMIPSIYVLRLSPREILVKKEDWLWKLY